MSQKITVPASGKSISIKATGVSVIIEECGVFETPEDAPKLKMIPGGKTYNIYPRSTYPDDDGGFTSLEIIGTEESAGTTVTIETTPQCLPLNMNILFNQSFRGRVGPSFVKTSSDTVQSFTELELADSDGILPSTVYVSARGADIVFAIDADPTNDAGTELGTVLKADGEQQPIVGINAILGFRFLSKVGATPGELTVHLEYGG